MLGTGGNYITIPHILSYFPKEFEKEIERIVIHNFGKYDFERKLFQCSNCSYLFDHGYIEIPNDTNFSCLSMIKCPACKRKNSKIIPQLEIQNISCPKCHHKGTLDSYLNMLWD